VRNREKEEQTEERVNSRGEETRSIYSVSVVKEKIIV